MRFAELFLDEDDALIFGRMRRKRHSSVYDSVGVISAGEAEYAVSVAKTLVQKIEMLI